MARGQSLYDWCMENGEYGQQLINEWTGISDDGKHYNIREVTAKTGRIRLKWICSKCGAERYSSIANRTFKPSLCKYCSQRNAQLVIGENDLLTWCNNCDDKEFGERLIFEFGNGDNSQEYTNENGKTLKIYEFARASTIEINWKCKDCGNIWRASIGYRTLQKTGCKKCYEKNIGNIIHNSLLKYGENDLYTWCKNNGAFGEKIITEFTGIDENNNVIDIKNIACKSNNKIMWKCSKCNNIFVQAVLNRTIQKQGCPLCNKYSTSYPEQFLYRALKQIYPQTISRGKFQGIEYDITIPEERTCIEYSGAIWHSDKLERDQMKADICKYHNMRFIQIYQNDDKEESVFEKDFIIYKRSSEHKSQLVYILDYILKSFNRSINEIDIEKAQTEAFNFMHDIESGG